MPRNRPCKPLSERLREKTQEIDSGCWEWTGNIMPNGYGVLAIGRRSLGERKTVYAHRVSYEFHRGPIPHGLDLDHLCRNRRCINPDHLEPVTRQENVLRGVGPRKASEYFAQITHCKHGHAFDEINTSPRKEGGRKCRKCGAIRTAKYKAKMKISAD